jgi:ketosteroid isomerase-like protein
MIGGRRASIALSALGIAAIAWTFWPESDEGAIRRRLRAAVEEANARTGQGLETVAKAARIGAYFTDDVVVDLGAGAAPLSGRQTLMGMATRLQPPTESLVVDLKDITVVKRPDTTVADVTLTATFTRRETSGAEETMDARELALEVRKEDGEWRIARVVAVDTLR